MLETQLFKEPMECPNFSAQGWKAGSSRPFDIISPYTNQPIGRSYESSKDDVREVIQAAAKASQEWGAMPIKDRTQYMYRFRQNLLDESEKIAQVASSESGKTFAEARAGLMKGVEVLEFALSLQNMDASERMQVSRGVYCEYRREPLGVVAGITPFNFPAMVPTWMLPIAITLGNSFVWKPSDKTPLTSLLLAEAFEKTGAPQGVLSTVQGGRETVEAILDDPEVKAVGFVGSTPIARSVYQRGAQNFKRVLALGGAKNHVVLMPDAQKEIAAPGITASFTGCAGQRCMAASVLLAVGDVDPIIDEVVQKAQGIQLGEQMGAIISKDSLEKLNQAIAQAEKDGANILLDGRNPQNIPENYKEGNWLAPTILDNVKPGSQAANEELFGPVLSIIRCNDLKEALKIENANPFGNAASVFTQSGGIAEAVAQNARAGMVGVNIGVPVPREPFSFGGLYESKFGYGDITGKSSLDFWSNTKKVTTKWARQLDQNWMS